MEEVLEIEKTCFEYPWQEEQFIQCLRQRNCIGMVAEYDDQVVGFMVYELHKNQIHVLNFAVALTHRHGQVGTQMVGKLVRKLSQQRRNRIILEIRETNVEAQVFFSEMGFRAVSVLKEYYDDSDEDAYVFQFRHHEAGNYEPTNRIARHNG
jgi:ribosomal-protein-alanine N-acetyltransferase